MKAPKLSFTVNVDVTNPGQFFACCGLLELAHCLWPDAEGCFHAADNSFGVYREEPTEDMERLFCDLRECTISGLSDQERREQDTLEAESRKLRKEGQKLSSDKEKRRKQLGTAAREGAILIGQPFNLILNWWQTADDDAATPKTWAGRQEIHRIARAAQDALSHFSTSGDLLNDGCVLRLPREYCKSKLDKMKSVEPFYFDAIRFAHALDAGFSLDAQDAETIAHPAIELLCLIGLQRFHPAATSARWSFDYWTWLQPLTAPVAASIVCGVVPTNARQGHRFQLRFRDDQKRYKAFGFANPIGGKK